MLCYPVTACSIDGPVLSLIKLRLRRRGIGFNLDQHVRVD
jgi:hypothetical protein